MWREANQYGPNKQAMHRIHQTRKHRDAVVEIEHGVSRGRGANESSTVRVLKTNLKRFFLRENNAVTIDFSPRDTPGITECASAVASSLRRERRGSYPPYPLTSGCCVLLGRFLPHPSPLPPRLQEERDRKLWQRWARLASSLLLHSS